MQVLKDNGLQKVLDENLHVELKNGKLKMKFVYPDRPNFFVSGNQAALQSLTSDSQYQRITS